MNAFKEGWFTELSPLWDGQAFSMEVDHVLHDEKSQFQHLVVLDTKKYGRSLILDGAIQCTEKDEFAYQEMMSFLPLTCHPNPESVLIIGGGDGGVAREVAKFPAVKRIVQCEIDQKVIDVSKQFLPFMASGFESSKLTLRVGDGFEFMGSHENEFDIIITDSSDPIGPAESLFGEKYYRLCKKALKPGGLICSQGENMWYHSEIIKSMMDFCQGLFPVVKYAYTCIPTYPGGQIGFILCGKDQTTNFEEPIHKLTDLELDEMNLRYYSAEIHKSAFTLPRFAAKILQTAKS